MVDAGIDNADVGIATRELAGVESPGAIKVSIFVIKMVTGGSVTHVVGSAVRESSGVPMVVVKYIVSPFSVKV